MSSADLNTQPSDSELSAFASAVPGCISATKLLATLAQTTLCHTLLDLNTEWDDVQRGRCSDEHAMELVAQASLVWKKLSLETQNGKELEHFQKLLSSRRL